MQQHPCWVGIVAKRSRFLQFPFALASCQDAHAKRTPSSSGKHAPAARANNNAVFDLHSRAFRSENESIAGGLGFPNIRRQ